jgi:hypothetical protein
MTDGYIYCFSNQSMPDLLKIGMTERTPEARLSEANASDTWRPPTPYKIEFAKKVSDASGKEKTLHALLEHVRINPRREFFRISREELRRFFDLMDGEMWSDLHDEEDEEDGEEDEEYEEDEENLSESVPRVKPNGIRGCRDMAKCFTHGQRIRHTAGINKIWTGTYDSLRNAIVYNGDFHKSLGSFASTHYRIDRPDRCHQANGWSECECEVDGSWVSTYHLPIIYQANVPDGAI